MGDVFWVGVWYRPRRSGDLGNRLKVLEDSLNEWAYLDDAQITGYDWRRSDEEPEHPRVELLLTGSAFASPRQAAEHRAKREAATKKRRATSQRNRMARELAARGVALKPSTTSRGR